LGIKLPLKMLAFLISILSKLVTKTVDIGKISAKLASFRN